MALTPEDRAYYEQKLGWNGYLCLLAATMTVGAIAMPLLLYIQDWSDGETSKWSFTVVRNLVLNGVMLGTIVSLVMFVLARFYLWLGWLPRRR
jgi:xanthine/uracil permease